MTESYNKKYKDVYLKEANTHVKNMNTGLLALEKNPDDIDSFNLLFRSTHTLKSMAATMRFEETAKLCHKMEDFLAQVRSGVASIKTGADLFFECFDILEQSIQNISIGKPEESATQSVEQLILLAGKASNNQAPGMESSNSKTIIPQSQTIKKIKSIAVKVERLDTLLNLSEEMLVNRLQLDLLRETINHPQLNAALDTLGRLVNDMQYNVMQVRLIPVSFVFDQFPRLVRDLAKSQNKEIDLTIEGGDIELDRSLIDELAETLIHLVRNAVDHGLENTEERVAAHKDARGTIKLNAHRSKDSVRIEVFDDGRGLNLNEIKKAGISRNILAPDASNEEIFAGLFKGISTSEKVSAVSGRGLGLTIAHQKIEAIGGKLRVESQANQSTHFYIDIPLTLAIIKILFVEIADEFYGIPLANIERLLTISGNELKMFLLSDAIIYDDETVPCVDLRSLFSGRPSLKNDEPLQLVVVRQGAKHVALIVDAMQKTQDVVIKPIALAVKHNYFFSGSAIIGSGNTILIVDVAALLVSINHKNRRRPNYDNRNL